MEKKEQNPIIQIQNLFNELNKNILKINDIILEMNTTIIQINNIILNNPKNKLIKIEENSNNNQMNYNLGRFFFTNKKDIQDLFESVLENSKNEIPLFSEKKEENIPKEESLSEEGLEKEAILIVMKEGHCTREIAIRALRKCNGDPVEALLDIGA